MDRHVHFTYSPKCTGLGRDMGVVGHGACRAHHALHGVLQIPCGALYEF